MIKRRVLVTVATMALGVMIFGGNNVAEAASKTLNGSYMNLKINCESTSGSADITNRNTSVARYVKVKCQVYDPYGNLLGNRDTDGSISSGSRTALVLGVRNAGSAYGTGTIFSSSSSSSSSLETLSGTVYRVSRAGVLK